jgi:hypothetical protein
MVGERNRAVSLKILELHKIQRYNINDLLPVAPLNRWEITFYLSFQMNDRQGLSHAPQKLS